MGYALASEAFRTVRVVVIQFDFWTIFWIFWIVVVPVGRLIWISVWVLRRYNRDLKARAALPEDHEPRPPQQGD